MRARLAGEDKIELRVPSDPVSRHFVAASLYQVGMGRNFSFSGGFCRLLCRSLERALFAANLAGEALAASLPEFRQEKRGLGLNFRPRAVTALSTLYKEPASFSPSETLKLGVQDEVCYAVEDETAPFVISVLVVE